MIRGVVFDLDGTLIDSMGIWYEIDRAFLRENGITEPPENISDIMKRMSVEECSEYFVNEFGLDITPEYAVKRIEELVRIEYEEKIALKPFVHELLEYLDEKGIPYGVAGSFSDAFAVGCRMLIVDPDRKKSRSCRRFDAVERILENCRFGR